MELVGIIGTIITSVGALIGVIITNKNANKELIHNVKISQAVFEAHVQEKIDNLTAEVKRTNAAIEHMYKLDTQQHVQGERISSLEKSVMLIRGGKS